MAHLLRGAPRLQLWFLQLMLERRDDLYTSGYCSDNFSLHQLHLELHIRYSVPAKADDAGPSQFLLFLKVSEGTLAFCEPVVRNTRGCGAKHVSLPSPPFCPSAASAPKSRAPSSKTSAPHAPLPP